MTFQKLCKIFLVAVMFLGVAFSAFNFLSVIAGAQAVEYKEEKLTVVNLPDNLPPGYDCEGEGHGCHTFTYPVPPGEPMPEY